MTSLKERFESRIRVTPGCWLWTGARCGDGYGNIRGQGRVLRAHRVSFQLYVGEIQGPMHGVSGSLVRKIRQAASAAQGA